MTTTKITKRALGADITIYDSASVRLAYQENVITTVSSGNATSVDCSLGTVFSHTLSENTTFSFINAPDSDLGFAFSLKLIQDSAGSGYTVTWPTTVDWTNATAPTLTSTADAVDWFVFSTTDNGTNWYGFTSGQAMG